MKPITWSCPCGQAMNVMARSPGWATHWSTPHEGGRPSRSGPAARKATLLSNPIGSPPIASCTPDGKAGKNVMAPDARTPVETVTMHPAASIVPRGVSTCRRGPPQRMAVTGLLVSTHPDSRRSTKSPSPPGSSRFGPSNRLVCQSRRLNAVASAAAITGASQFTTAFIHGISPPRAAMAARLVSGPASAASVSRASSVSAASKPACSAGVIERPRSRVTVDRTASLSIRTSPWRLARSASGLRPAACSQEAPMSNVALPSAAGCVVHARPPMRALASNTRTACPARRKAIAAASPATPAPTITYSAWSLGTPAPQGLHSISADIGHR